MKTESEELQTRKNKRASIGCLVVMVLFVIAIIGAITWPSEPTDNFKTDKTTQAYIISKHVVKSQLEFPEAAEFPFVPVLSEIQEGTDSIYRVVSDVTIVNAFGVPTKRRYNCRMKYIGGDPIDPNSWEVVDLSL